MHNKLEATLKNYHARSNLLHGVTQLPTRWLHDPGNQRYTKPKWFPPQRLFHPIHMFCLHFSLQVNGWLGRVVFPYVALFAMSPTLIPTHWGFFLPRRQRIDELFASELARPCIESADCRRTSLLASIVAPCISESLSHAVAIYL